VDAGRAGQIFLVDDMRTEDGHAAQSTWTHCPPEHLHGKDSSSRQGCITTLRSTP
jgi:hypothetical protein